MSARNERAIAEHEERYKKALKVACCELGPEMFELLERNGRISKQQRSAVAAEIYEMAFKVKFRAMEIERESA